MLSNEETEPITISELYVSKFLGLILICAYTINKYCQIFKSLAKIANSCIRSVILCCIR